MIISLLILTHTIICIEYYYYCIIIAIIDEYIIAITLLNIDTLLIIDY